ncbi:TonB-dependent receptor [Sphingomonas sp. MMS24-J13]|uniref:TonB-dependent receptor n=1 Tax=Sphingomonas sp. MMS24-J13 TaxID=3238686 RepID=UPI0038512426
MRRRHCLRHIMSGIAIIGFHQTAAAQSAGGAAPATQGNGATQADGSSSSGDIIVTARRKEERLSDVPISVTAVSGDALRDQQANNVRDVARITPSLNIDSDSPTRAFISIRGIGTTLSDSVQPGVGIFVDGIYEPATSFFNSPLVDVERVEVLRGPQGTLFGNNTLGGAINIVTRQPTNDLTGRIDGSYAPQDDFRSLSGSISGPIVSDVVQFRIGGAYHHQDGFIKNSLIGGNLNPATQESLKGTLRILPATGATITINANYDKVRGGFFPYNQVAGPEDYQYAGAQNVNSIGEDRYYGLNAKGEFDLTPLKTKMTLIASYNLRKREVNWDVDLGPTDFLRSHDFGRLRTINFEGRFETQWSDTISSLVGLFYSQYRDRSETNTFVVPANLLSPAVAHTSNRNEAVFATVFWKPSRLLELALGARYDDQSLKSSQAFTSAAYKAKELQPRATATLHWTSDFMSYASVARGVRGGGQNPPGSPNLIYRNDSVWTYEVGTKFSALDRRLTVAADVFYNDYSNYIGVNAIVPSTASAAAIAVNLNTGTVRSYGAEVEATFRVTPNFRLYGNLGLLHARTTDMSGFIAVTGFRLPTDKILYTADWTFNAGATQDVHVGRGVVSFDANVSGKGRRPGFSYSQVAPTFLAPYYITNASIAYKINRLELAVFSTNLFNEKYYVTYFDKSILGAALPPGLAYNTGVTGDRRRIGVRASIGF